MVNAAAAAAKSLQSCLTLCNPVEGSPPGSPVPGILQARTPEWVAMSFSNAWQWKVKVELLSRVWLFPTPWTAAYQAPLSLGFFRQEHWSGLPLPSPYGQWANAHINLDSVKLTSNCQQKDKLGLFSYNTALTTYALLALQINCSESVSSKPFYLLNGNRGVPSQRFFYNFRISLACGSRSKIC